MAIFKATSIPVDPSSLKKTLEAHPDPGAEVGVEDELVEDGDSDLDLPSNRSESNSEG